MKKAKDIETIIKMLNELPNYCHEAVINSMIDTLEYHIHLFKMFEKCIYCKKEEKQIKLL